MYSLDVCYKRGVTGAEARTDHAGSTKTAVRQGASTFDHGRRRCRQTAAADTDDQVTDRPDAAHEHSDVTAARPSRRHQASPRHHQAALRESQRQRDFRRTSAQQAVHAADR